MNFIRDSRNTKNGEFVNCMKDCWNIMAEGHTGDRMNDIYTESQLNEDKAIVSRMDISDQKKEVKYRHLAWLRTKQPQGNMERYRKAIIEA